MYRGKILEDTYVTVTLTAGNSAVKDKNTSVGMVKE